MNNSAPLILGFDTSGSYCAAAVVQGEDLLAHHREDMTKGQAEHLMALLDGVLKQAGCTYQDLDAIGVGIGPGNFTGIRIAVSAARGLAFGLSVPAVGVSAFDALRLGTEGLSTSLVDARRGEVYAQVYKGDGSANQPLLGKLDELTDLETPYIGAGAQEPVYPVAEAIARLAAIRAATATERPAPMYLRPADAAPARDRGPKILP